MQHAKDEDITHVVFEPVDGGLEDLGGDVILIQSAELELQWYLWLEHGAMLVLESEPSSSGFVRVC